MKEPAERGTLVKKKRIETPPNGWQDNSLYIVEVAFRPTNPVFSTLFFTGFVHNGIPGGYNQFCLLPEITEYHEAHYLYPVRLIAKQAGTLWSKV